MKMYKLYIDGMYYGEFGTITRAKNRADEEAEIFPWVYEARVIKGNYIVRMKTYGDGLFAGKWSCLKMPVK